VLEFGIAVEMRFDDRVTGDLSKYAKQADIVHVEVDPAGINKIVDTKYPVVGDAKKVLSKLIPLVEKNEHPGWLKRFKECYDIEYSKVIERDIYRNN
jgi:acetolactate synthase-1/2/3 large subunit